MLYDNYKWFFYSISYLRISVKCIITMLYFGLIRLYLNKIINLKQNNEFWVKNIEQIIV